MENPIKSITDPIKGLFSTPDPTANEKQESSAFNTQENFNTNTKIIKKVFNDKETYNFKFGLQANQINNLDEDPVIYGFDIIIHDTFINDDRKIEQTDEMKKYVADNSETNTISGEVSNGKKKGEFGFDKKFTSPLINGAIPNFMEFVNIPEINSKKEIYQEFIDTLKLFFNDTTHEFSSFKSHYIKSVSGLHTLIENATGFTDDNKQFTKYGTDKITIECYEDTYLNSGFLAALYKNFTYSKMNGKMLIPENLLKFDISIIISEIRNFNLVVDTLNKSTTNTQTINNSANTIKVFNDNISRYIYNLYECQFRFPTYSHDDVITNESIDFAKSFTFDIYYKFSTMEMEKFKFNGDSTGIRKYINNANINSPTDKYDRIKGTASNSTPVDNKQNRVYDLKYRSFYDNGKNAYRKWDKTGIVELDNEETDFLGDVKNNILDKLNNTKKFALTRIRQERDGLINKTLDNIRTNTGLRRISSPINVYDTNPRSISDYFFGQMRDFANEGVNNLLKKANDKLGDISKNLDIEKLNKGEQAQNTGKYSGTDQDVRNAAGFTNDENVYIPKK